MALRKAVADAQRDGVAHARARAVVLGSVLPIEGAKNILGVIRLLRVLKIIKTIPQLHVIVAGLAKGVGSITYIALLLALVYPPFILLVYPALSCKRRWTR